MINDSQFVDLSIFIALSAIAFSLLSLLFLKKEKIVFLRLKLRNEINGIKKIVPLLLFSPVFLGLDKKSFEGREFLLFVLAVIIFVYWLIFLKERKNEN